MTHCLGDDPIGDFLNTIHFGKEGTLHVQEPCRRLLDQAPQVGLLHTAQNDLFGTALETAFDHYG